MARQTWAVLASALLAMAGPAHAGDGSVHVVSDGMGLFIPASSPVRLASMSRHETLVKFRGRFAISGFYSIVCDDFVADPCAPESLEVYIEPDARLLARLPRWDMYKANRPLIEIDDAANFIKANLDAPTLAAFRKGRIMRKTGYASMVVEDLATGVDCDSPWYSARLVSFAPVTQVASREPDGNRGCG